MQILAWEEVMEHKSVPWSDKGLPSTSEELNVECSSRVTDRWRTNDENVIAREVNLAVNELVSKESSTMIEESLDDIYVSHSVKR